MRYRTLTLSLLAFCLLLIAPKHSQAQGSSILIFGDRPADRSALETTLTNLGYSVTNQDNLPADLSPYDTIWQVSALTPLSAGEQSQLADFVNNGGGIYLQGERPCCELLNDSVESLLNSLVLGGGITVGDQGDILDPDGAFVAYPFNPNALGGITANPNSLSSTMPALSMGGLDGLGTLPDPNILTYGMGDVPVAGIWDSSDLINNAGRIILNMDVDWFIAYPEPQISPIIQNFQCFLGREACNFSPVASISATDPDAAEPNDPGEFLISLDVPNSSGGPITINYSISGTASNGSDYEVIAASAIIAPNASSVIVPLLVLDDLLFEGGESVILTLTGSSHPFLSIGPANSATVTITDDDPPPVAQPTSDPGGNPPGGGGQPGTGIAALGLGPASLSKLGFPSADSSIIEWQLSVTNGSVASSQLVSDTLPPNLRLERVEAPGATVNVNGQQIQVISPLLAPGQSYRFSIFTRSLDASPAQNTACLGSDCVSGTVISRLPATGESPAWRLPMVGYAIGGSLAMLGLLAGSILWRRGARRGASGPQ